MPDTIGILVNRTKKNADAVTYRLVDTIKRCGGQVYIDDQTAHDLNMPEFGLPLEQFPERVDLLFVLGGDGTLLGAARQFACFDLPMLGINIGHLGFLSEAEPENLETTVSRALHGDFYLERRMMLETEVWRQDELIHHSIGLNDAGVGKGSFARMIQVQIDVNGDLYDDFLGDGVIVSTPTGSTAYSLSCGGPIMQPHMQVLLITPICAHKLVARPCIISSEQEIRIKVLARHQDMGLTVDGQVGFPLQSGDFVYVRKSKCDTVLIRWQERPFFSILRNKLRGD
jgi:NAD+ kinase